MKPKKVIEDYKRLIKEKKTDYEKMGCGSEQSMLVKYATGMSMLDLGIDDKILDVGCGLCGLYGYLKANPWTIYDKRGYYGIDVMPYFIKESKKRYPELKKRLECIDLRLEKNEYDLVDWVVCNGVLVDMDSIKDVENFVEKMFAICKKGLLITTGSNFLPSGGIEQLMLSPADMIAVARRFTPYIDLKLGYHTHSLAICLYKDAKHVLRNADVKPYPMPKEW